MKRDMKKKRSQIDYGQKTDKGRRPVPKKGARNTLEGDFRGESYFEGGGGPPPKGTRRRSSIVDLEKNKKPGSDRPLRT